jgi:predicted transcriptional regulator
MATKTETTRVLFNTTKRIKDAAKKRAYREGSDLTSVLNQAMLLYSEGSFDPDDFLSKEDMVAIRRGLADVKAGRVYNLEQVKEHFRIIDEKSGHAVALR